MPRFLPLPSLALFALCAGICPHAGAVTVLSDSGPANYCRPALPVFDAQVRTRPLAIRNEGSSPVFISCAMPTESLPGGINRTGNFFIDVRHDSPVNTGSDSIEIACTAISGDTGFTALQAVTRSHTLSPGESATLSWQPSNFPEGEMLRAMSFSCVLPSKGAIGNMKILVQDNGT